MELLNDNIYDILLRSDIQTIENFCNTNKHTHNVCPSEIFWQDKLRYNHLPNFTLDKIGSIQLIAEYLKMTFNF